MVDTVLPSRFGYADRRANVFLRYAKFPRVLKDAIGYLPRGKGSLVYEVES
jgi:hypothetical protein